MLLLGRTCCCPGADLAAPPPPLAPPRPPPSRWDWLRVREVERGLATCRLEMLELLLISLLDTHTEVRPRHTSPTCLLLTCSGPRAGT